jgi:hypothetical protein
LSWSSDADARRAKESDAMLNFMLEGGVPMVFILVFGVVTLVAAGLFMWRPEAHKVGFLVWMSAATVFATLSGIISDLGAVFTKVPSNPEWAQSPDVHLIVMTGLGESTRPGTLGFSLLMLVALLVAVGYRRMPRTASGA